MRSRMPRASEVSLPRSSVNGKLFSSCFALDPTTYPFCFAHSAASVKLMSGSCAMTARRAKCLWTLPYAFERSSWTSVSVGLSFCHPRRILAGTSAPIGVLTASCPMCRAFPSPICFAGFCVLSWLSVHYFHQYYLRELHQRFGEGDRSHSCSVSRQVVLSVLRSMLSFLGVLASFWSKPLSTLQLLGWLFLSPLGPRAAPALI